MLFYVLDALALWIYAFLYWLIQDKISWFQDRGSHFIVHWLKDLESKLDSMTWMYLFYCI